MFPLADILLLVGAVLCAAFYLYTYLAAEQPKAGTLEWIKLYEKPKMTRQGLLSRLQWQDSLWGVCVITAALGAYTGIHTAVDVSMLRTAVASGAFYLSALPACLAALLVFLAAKLLTGKAGLSVLAAVFAAGVIPSGSTDPYIAGVFLLGSFLLLLLWLHHDGVCSWLSLVFSALLLIVPPLTAPAYFLFVLPWLAAVVLGEILRIRQDDRSIWHLIATLAAGAGTLALGTVGLFAFVYHGVNQIPLAQALTAPDLYQSLLRYVCASVSMQMPYPATLVISLSTLSLLAAGCIALPAAATARRDCRALLLLFWTVASLPIYLLTCANFTVYTAALCLAWLTGRIHSRKLPGAAYVIACIPIFVNLILAIFTLMEV